MLVRIHITGASGSGTTTLGKALSERFGWPHFDSDDFYWEATEPPFQRSREAAERQALLTAALKQQPSWVLSGSICGWGDIFIPWFDLVVFLWLPAEERLARLVERERRRFGEAALAPGGEMYETHRKFMTWAAGYDEGGLEHRSRQKHEQWLKAIPCAVLRLDGARPAEEHLDRIAKHLGADQV